MNIVIDPTTFNENNIFFLDKKKNNIIDGYFSKIIYSSDVFIMNGVFLVLPLVIKTIPDNSTIIERRTSACVADPSTSLSHEHRYTIYFYTHHLINLQYITILSEIENAIINMYKEINCVKKTSNLGLSNQLYKGCFKIYKERKHGVAASQKKYMLKISGVWENAAEVGITYKFVEIF